MVVNLKSKNANQYRETLVKEVENDYEVTVSFKKDESSVLFDTPSA